jgi:adenine/guanine phosphoribosyltransferase-like PRPP-binding protein
MFMVIKKFESFVNENFDKIYGYEPGAMLIAREDKFVEKGFNNEEIGQQYLTKGKEYEMINFTGDRVIIIDDLGYRHALKKDLFDAPIKD